MSVRMSIELIRWLLAEAAATPAVEVCGLLFGTERCVVHAERCDNVAMRPENGFEIDPAALLAAHRRARAGGPAMIGYYHSHPSGDACPSERDAATAVPDGRLWLIISDGAVTAWRAMVAGPVHGRFVREPLLRSRPS